MEEETGRLMIETRPFKKDREKFYTIAYGMDNPGFLKKLKLFLGNYGLHIVAVYRLGRMATLLYSRSRIAGFLPLLFYRFLNLFIKTIHHVYIDRRAEIGPGFFLSVYPRGIPDRRQTVVLPEETLTQSICLVLIPRPCPGLCYCF